MGLFERNAARGEPVRPAAAAGYDFVEVPTPEGSVTRMTKGQFEAQPLADRIRILVDGTAVFFRGDAVVPASEALKSTR
jgi:hypothetical protein